MKPSVTDYNRIASTYNQRYEVDRLDGISKVLSDLFNKYNFKNILEIGCGTGRWLAELTKQNNLCVGLDRSIRMIHEARKSETVIPFLVGDALKLPFKNSTFDFVYCAHVLEHVEYPKAALDEIIRVGKQGYIEVPTKMSDIVFNFVKLQHFHKWYISAVGNTLIFMEYTKKEQRDTGDQELFYMAHSLLPNPIKSMYRRNKDLFTNMFSWKDKFDYYIFDQNGHLLFNNVKQ